MATNTTPGAIDQETIKQTIQDIAKEYGRKDKNFTSQLARYSSAIAAGYDAQRKASDEQYALNRSAADRAAMSRGMGRSSYNLQTLSNIDTKKAEANQEIWRNQQADLNKFAYQLNQDMLEQERWQKEYELQLAQLRRSGGGGGGGYYPNRNNSYDPSDPSSNLAGSTLAALRVQLAQSKANRAYSPTTDFRLNRVK
jgi:hypothetical protein